MLVPAREEPRRGGSLTSHVPLWGRTTFYQAIGVGRTGTAPAKRTSPIKDTAETAGQVCTESRSAEAAPVCQPVPDQPLTIRGMHECRHGSRMQTVKCRTFCMRACGAMTSIWTMECLVGACPVHSSTKQWPPWRRATHW